METFDTSEELIKECIRDLYLDPRNLILKWSKITNQTSQVRLAYPGQHLASVITGIKGMGTAARGDDLSDGSEVKSCSRADQLSECIDCGAKVLPWQRKCPICGSSNINIKTDSHWIFSIKSEEELNFLLNEVPRIILILFDRESIESETIRLRAWVVDPKHPYAKAFFEEYFYNNYMIKINKGEKNPAPCNLHPLKFDFYMMEPKLIFHAEINIEKRDVEIKFWNVENPKIEPIPMNVLKTTEIKEIFADEIKKGLTVEQIKGKYSFVPVERRKFLKMREKIIKKYKEKYRRRR